MNPAVVPLDLECNVDKEAHLTNDTVRSFAWLKIQVEIKHTTSGIKPKQIIADLDGYAAAGKSEYLRPCSVINET